jgi:hypothetical protein
MNSDNQRGEFIRGQILDLIDRDQETLSPVLCGLPGCDKQVR